VKFIDDDQPKRSHNADIRVKVLNQYLVKVKLGFLQVRHRYEITFEFDCGENMENCFDLHSAALPGHVKIVELKSISKSNNKAGSASSDSCSQCTTVRHRATAHLFACKEKLLKEKLCLFARNAKTHSLTFIFQARVLGAGKGTPFLKQGIKSIGYDPLEDDDGDEEGQDDEEEMLSDEDDEDHQMMVINGSGMANVHIED